MEDQKLKMIESKQARNSALPVLVWRIHKV